MNIEKAIKTERKMSLSKRMIINLTMVSSAVDTHFAEVLKPFDLTLQQFNVLRILRGQDGKALNLRDVQSRMVHKKSNTTRLIDKLITKKLVDRKICPSNRRKVEIEITQAGKYLLQQVDIKMDCAERDLVKDFSKEEIRQLDLLLDRISF